MKGYLLSLCAVALILLAACSGTSTEVPIAPTETREIFSLRWKVEPEDAGRVAPDGGEYPAGKKVILNALAKEGYVFESWSGDLSGTERSVEITMDSDKLVIANFSEPATATPEPSATPRPTPTATPDPCRKPADVTAADTGQLIEVCGEVTNWGVVPCPECALGGYSFLKLDGAFLIISYDWVFNNNWIGNCIIVADTVEMLGAAPVFIFGTGEGYAGSECTTAADGSRSCASGDYFLLYYGCGTD